MHFNAATVSTLPDMFLFNTPEYTLTGFIQGSLSKIQGLFKEFSRLFYSFQGLKV